MLKKLFGKCSVEGKTFWEHDWSKWEVVHKTNILRSEDSAIVGMMEVQARVCKRCGLTERKSDTMYL